MQASKFYTFYDFTSRNGYPPFKPLIQKRLQRRMKRLASLHPSWSGNTWIDYFIKIIKDSSSTEYEKRFAHLHLLAYMDLDRCYFIWRDFCKLPFYAANSCELYDLSNSLLFQRDRFKKYIYKYDSKNTSGANLKTYILAIVRNFIREKLDLKSSWRLLCDVDIDSNKRFTRALQKRRDSLERYGITEPYISRYIFALRYFILVYKTNRVLNPNRREGSRWPEPEWSDFVEVASLYNSHRFLSHAPLQVSAGAEVTPETVKKWIDICIKALQLAPIVIEYDLNSYVRLNNELSNPWQYLNLEAEQTNILEQADLVLRSKIQIIEGSFETIRSKIPQQFRHAVMPLCYPHLLAPLNQEKLSNKIGVHQGTISRYIAKHFENPLLEEFKQFTNEKLELESYLAMFLDKKITNPKFFNLLDKILVEAISKLDRESQKILRLRYSQHMDFTDIARALSRQQNIKPHEIMTTLIKVEHELRKEFEQNLNKWQAEYIKLWIKSYYQNMIQSILLNSFQEFDDVIQEILRMKYCQNLNEPKIINFYPNLDVVKAIRDAKQHLQQALLRWSDDNLGISLVREEQEVMKIVEDWLATSLIYLEL